MTVGELIKILRTYSHDTLVEVQTPMRVGKNYRIAHTEFMVDMKKTWYLVAGEHQDDPQLKLVLVSEEERKYG